MIVTALNIRSGGGSRVERLLDYLERSGSTLIVLTEWRQGLCGRRIAAWADEQGLHHASLTDGGTANGVFVAAKQRFGVTSRRPTEAGAGVLLQAEFANFGLLACYFPQGDAKRPFFKRCCEIASAHADVPFALMGDLNTGNQVVDKDVLGARFHCATEFDGLLSHHGLQDLWRRSNGDEAREWSWCSARRNGFRIDHAFANQAFVELADPCCRYDHAPRDRLDTDHSVLHVVCSDSLVRRRGTKPHSPSAWRKGGKEVPELLPRCLMNRAVAREACVLDQVVIRIRRQDGDYVGLVDCSPPV